LEEQGGVGGLDLGGVEADLLLQDVVDETAQGHGVHVAYELQAGTTAHHTLDVWPIRVDGLQQPVQRGAEGSRGSKAKGPKPGLLLVGSRAGAPGALREHVWQTQMVIV